MNYFAHGYRFLDEPYFVAGTAVPDWLAVVDRQVRLRPRHVAPLAGDADRRVASLALGLLQHFRDDARFHDTRAFVETSLALAVRARDALGHDPGFRPSFLGHLLTEVLLDAVLIQQQPALLEAYYAAIAAVDARLVQAAVNRMAPRPTDRLRAMIAGFSRERFLSDYGEDAKLMVRLGQVMRRARLAPLPESFCAVLAPARRLVAERQAELLDCVSVAEEDRRCVTA